MTTNELKRRYLFSIEVAAQFIENSLGSILIPYPEGLYFKGHEKPVVQFNQKYYRIDRTPEGALIEVPVMSAADLTGNIFSIDGEVVISRSMLLNGGSLISNKPTVPVYGREIVFAAIQDFLQRIQIYKKNTKCESGFKEIIEKLVEPRFQNPANICLIKDHLLEATRDIFYDIRQFTTKSGWDVLLVERNRDTVIIDDVGDFRIHEYYRMIGEQKTK